MGGELGESFAQICIKEINGLINLFSVQCWSQTIHETRQPFWFNRKRPRKFRDTGVCTGAPWMMKWLQWCWSESEENTQALKEAWIWWGRGYAALCRILPWAQRTDTTVTRKKGAGFLLRALSEEMASNERSWGERQHGWEFNYRKRRREIFLFLWGSVHTYKLGLSVTVETLRGTCWISG